MRARQGLPRGDLISGLNGPARDTRCLRFARTVACQDARLASGCWPDSPGWALWPTGFLRKVLSCFLHLSSFPRLLLAQACVGLINLRASRSAQRAPGRHTAFASNYSL